MSILIKGMEMPTDCDNCSLFDDRFDYPSCNATGYSRGYNWNPRGQRMPDCPLIEIPPHGDLIDRDALMKSDRMVGKLMMFGGEYVYTQSEIDCAPTVIPADEDGEA